MGRLLAALLLALQASCASAPAPASSTGVAEVTVLTSPKPRVLGKGDIWGYAQGGPATSVWRVVLAESLGSGDPLRAEAVALHELWHVLTLNREDHSGIPGTVSRGEVGGPPYAVEIQPRDLEGLSGRSFVLVPPKGQASIEAAVRRAAASWNRRLGYEAFTWRGP